MNLTLIIILITCGISLLAWNNSKIFNRLVFNPYSVVNRKEWHRMFTGALLHADMTHLVINMFVLFSFGNVMEQIYADYLPFGSTMYLVLYVVSVAVANLKTLREQKHNVWYNAVGASGAVSAVVFAYILVAPKESIYFFGILPIPAFIYGFLYLLYSQYMAKNATDNIGHDAHFFGAVFGFLFTGMLRPQLFSAFFAQIFSF